MKYKSRKNKTHHRRFRQNDVPHSTLQFYEQLFTRKVEKRIPPPCHTATVPLPLDKGGSFICRLRKLLRKLQRFIYNINRLLGFYRPCHANQTPMLCF